MPVEKRVAITSEKAGLTDEEAELLCSGGGLGLEEADRMIENVVGTIAYPLGIAANFRKSNSYTAGALRLSAPNVPM